MSVRAIDLFAGWGGFTLAAEQAGADVVWAANHWRTAVQVHQANHPTAAHACQDLRQADWTALPRFDLLLASPACQGHSTAAQPKRRLYHDALRATAWAVLDCADVTSPRTVIVENVPAFRRWRLFPVWREAWRALGYHLQELEITASHHDTPQRRERLFIVATRRPVRLHLERHAEPAFGPCIEWGAGTWRPLDQVAPAARVRFEAAQRNHGPRCLSQHVTGHPGVALTEPIRTITTKDQWVVLDGPRYRPLTEREYARAMGFPDSFTWGTLTRTDVIKGLGNAVCPPAGAAVIRAALEAA